MVNASPLFLVLLTRQRCYLFLLLLLLWWLLFLLLCSIPNCNMASISQGLVLTTAMVLSSTVLYLTFSKQKTPNSTQSEKQILRSCLYSEEKKREKRRKNKKKVKFSENVLVKEEEERDSSHNEEIIEEQRKKNRGSNSNNCRNEIHETRGMPANRVALYNGILRDRVHRMASCH